VTGWAHGRWEWALACGLFALAIVQAVSIDLSATGQSIFVGRDLELYLNATRGWIAGGSFYPGHQLTGAYEIVYGDILYPPTVLLMFIPFVFLPAVLWWAIPLATIASVVVFWRPSLMAIALISVCTTFPNTVALVLNGNPAMWVCAAVALGTRFGWPAVLAMIKPPIGLVGLLWAGHRNWWIAGAVVVAASIPFGSLWLDFVTVIKDARPVLGPFYSLSDMPFVLLPVVAWIGSSSFRPPGVAFRLPTIRSTPPEHA
jgi:hypothetical protein